MTVTAYQDEHPQSTLAEAQTGIIACLKQQPGVPFPVGLIAELLSLSPLQIEAALESIEGPVEGSEAPGAYLHIARCSNQAVYIP